jgi:hypothetical protein
LPARPEHGKKRKPAAKENPRAQGCLSNTRGHKPAIGAPECGADRAA